MNARLKLVARLKGYKESRGMSFLDPEREEWMLQYLARANRGPLSAEGLKELFEEILRPDEARGRARRELRVGAASISADAVPLFALDPPSGASGSPRPQPNLALQSS